MASFPYRINAGSDVEINANGRIKHNASVQYLHADDSLLSDIQALNLADGDLLVFNGSNIIPKPSSDFANASDLQNYSLKASLSSDLDSLNVVRASDLIPYAQSADVSATYQTKADMSAYAQNSDVSATYQTKADMSAYLATNNLSNELDGLNVVRNADLIPYAQSADVSATYQTKADMSAYVATNNLSTELDGLNVVRNADLNPYALSADVATNYQAKADMGAYLQTNDLQGSIQGLTGITLSAPGIAGEVLQDSVKKSGVVVIASHANSPVTAYDLNIAGSSNVFKINATSTLKGTNGTVCVVKKEVVMHLSAGACLPVSGTDNGSFFGASDNGNELQITCSTTHAYIKVQSTSSNDASGAKSIVEYEIIEC
jgi:hypothetical protein